MVRDLLHRRATFAAFLQKGEGGLFASCQDASRLRSRRRSGFRHPQGDPEMSRDLLELRLRQTGGNTRFGHAPHAATPLLDEMELAEKPRQNSIAWPGNAALDVLDGRSCRQ